jgi:hypothetical protein
MAEDASAFREIGRARFIGIWRAIQAGDELEGEEAIIGTIMQDHPEYREAWDREEPPREPDYTIEGINPFLHVSTHLVVENQAALGEPPEVREARDRMQRNGRTPHDAAHRIGTVLAEEIQKALLAGRPVNISRYRRRVRKLF